TPVEVGDRRNRRVARDADVVSHARHEPESALAATASGQLRNSDPPAEEKPTGRLGIVVERQRCVAGRQRRPAYTLGPPISLAADQEVWAQCASELQIAARGALGARASGAREPERPVPEPESDPEALTSLRVLRPRTAGGAESEETGYGENLSDRTHATSKGGRKCSKLRHGVEKAMHRRRHPHPKRLTRPSV